MVTNTGSRRLGAALLAATILTSGCSSAVVKVSDSAPSTIRVEWVRGTRAEVAFYCQATSRRLLNLAAGRTGSQEAVACTDALPARGTCTIYTTSEVTLETLGDELAHCFLGAWHN